MLESKAIAYIDVPLKDAVDPDVTVREKLPFIDPHEYLEWLWRSGRADVSDEQIASLVYT